MTIFVDSFMQTFIPIGTSLRNLAVNRVEPAPLRPNCQIPRVPGHPAGGKPVCAFIH